MKRAWRRYSLWQCSCLRWRLCSFYAKFVFRCERPTTSSCSNRQRSRPARLLGGRQRLHQLDQGPHRVVRICRGQRFFDGKPLAKFGERESRIEDAIFPHDRHGKRAVDGRAQREGEASATLFHRLREAVFPNFGNNLQGQFPISGSGVFANFGEKVEVVNFGERKIEASQFDFPESGNQVEG
jgi:hypothetical protein